MNNLVFLPPVTFLIVLIFVALQAATFKKLAFKSKNEAKGKTKAYACGEDIPCHKVAPEYRQFFPFAFFFTIMHVVAMMLATLPMGHAAPVFIFALYLFGGFAALLILYRR